MNKLSKKKFIFICVGILAISCSGILFCAANYSKFDISTKLIYNNYNTVAKIYIRYFCGVNCSVSNGFSLLHYSVSCNKISMIQWLILNGADINKRENVFGIPPIFYVKSIEAAELLKKYGADLNAKDKCNRSFLFYFVLLNFNEELVAWFIKNGADIFTPDNDGVSPLFYSSFINFNLCKILMNNGMSIRQKSIHDETLLQYLLYTPYFPKADAVYLIAKGIEVNHTDASGYTALMIASFTGNLDVVKVLLDNNADLRLKDSMKKTALDYAREYGHEDIVKLLEEAEKKALEKSE